MLTHFIGNLAQHSYSMHSNTFSFFLLEGKIKLRGTVFLQAPIEDLPTEAAKCPLLKQ